MDNQAVENIALVIGIIVATSLALTQAMGGLVMYLVEAIKQTGKIRDGYSGLVAIVVGILLGMGLAGLADGMAAEPYGLSTMLLLGAFAGAMMAAGAVKTYKATGDMNVNPERTDMATMTDLDNAMRLMEAHAAPVTMPAQPRDEFPDVSAGADFEGTVDELSRVGIVRDDEVEATAATMADIAWPDAITEDEAAEASKSTTSPLL